MKRRPRDAGGRPFAAEARFFGSVCPAVSRTESAAVRLLCRKFRYINGFHAFLLPFSALFFEVSDRATFQLHGASSVLYHNAAGK